MVYAEAPAGREGSEVIPRHLAFVASLSLLCCGRAAAPCESARLKGYADGAASGLALESLMTRVQDTYTCRAVPGMHH